MGIYRYTHVRKKGGLPATNPIPYPLALTHCHRYPPGSNRDSMNSIDPKRAPCYPMDNHLLYPLFRSGPITTDTDTATPSRNFPEPIPEHPKVDKKSPETARTKPLHI